MTTGNWRHRARVALGVVSVLWGCASLSILVLSVCGACDWWRGGGRLGVRGGVIAVQEWVSVVVIPLLIVSGVGVICRKEWGRRLSMISGLCILSQGLVGLVLDGLAIIAWQYGDLARRIYVGGYVANVVGLTFPVLLVLVMRRSRGDSLLSSGESQ